MKIVRNSCYGGFSLSAKAVKRIAELKGKECFFFNWNFGKYEPITLEECSKTFMWSAYSVPNPNDYNLNKIDEYDGIETIREAHRSW